jgi:hypothetical protein
VAEKDDQVCFRLKFSDHILGYFNRILEDETLSPKVGWTQKNIRGDQAKDSDSQTIDLLQQIGLEEKFSRSLINEVRREKGEFSLLGEPQQELFPKAQIVVPDTQGIVIHQIKTLDNDLGLVHHFLLLILWNGIREFLKKKIASIQNQYLFAILSQFRHPCSPPGQTADPARLTSGRTGFDLTIQIIAIEDGERLCLLLGMGRKGIDDQKTSQ